MIDTSRAGLTPAISLRPSTVEDLEFLFQVYADTRAEELSVVPWSVEQKATFLRMQFHAQHKYYHENFKDAAFDLIIENDVPIGRLYVHRTKNVLNVVDITVLPAWRGKGIGGGIMRALIDEAKAIGQVVKIYVEHNNRAMLLYRKLGFVQTGTEGVYYAMEWRATPK